MAVSVVVLVLVSGALGAVLRYLVSRALPTAEHPRSVPRAVLIVNVAGSFIAGVVLALGSVGALSPSATLIVVTGLCGGLTTFSTFSVESIELFMQGAVRVAWGNIAANVVFSLISGALGFVPLYSAFS